MRAALLLALCVLSPGLASPTDEAQAGTLPTPAQVAAQIDALVETVWQEAGIKPRPLTTDAEFLRRASLDTTGAIPSEIQTRSFLADKSGDKRAELIDDLLDDPGYGRTMALRWAYLLVGRDYLFRSLNQGRARQAMRRMSMEDSEESSGNDEPAPRLVEWLEEALNENRGWDEIATDLITAEGDASQNGAAHYIVRYARDGKAEEIAGNAMRIFQGLQIQCAQCHDHPYTDWSQQDFYGVAAFFSRIVARRELGANGKRTGPFVVSDRLAGQIRIPAPPGETGRLVLPRFLTGEIIRPTAPDRRAQLAKLVTGPKNPWFAQATVNRIWSFFFGRGLANPIDDLELAEDDALPEVYALLVDDFRRSGYDVRRLCEVILNTSAYQRSSAGPEEGREAELTIFARAPLRSLSAEQLFYSVLQATGSEEIRPEGLRARRQLERMKYNLLRQFLQTFGDDEAEEVVDEGTIPQALLLLNGPLTNDAVRPRPGHPLYDALFAVRDPGQRVQMLYLRVLSREPTRQELKVAKRLLEHAGPRDAKATALAYADMVWALLNSPEFCFNH